MKPKDFVQSVIESLPDSFSVLFDFAKRYRENVVDVQGKRTDEATLPRCTEAITQMQVWFNTESAAVILQNISLATTVLGMFLVRIFCRCACGIIQTEAQRVFPALQSTVLLAPRTRYQEEMTPLVTSGTYFRVFHTQLSIELL